MQVLIIEDETPAAQKLERYLLKCDAEIKVVKVIASISESVTWLKQNQERISLIFMDIQLTDGLSFDIFSQVSVTKPLIFTTAFDEYAIDAFKLNSVDYLLKPITFTDLSNALKKLTKLKLSLNDIEDRSNAIQHIAQKRYKDRFLVKLGNNIHSIEIEKISFFYSEGRTIYLVSNDNKKFIIDYKMQDLEEMIDPNQFFRVNRSFIIRLKSISNVAVYSNSRLKIDMSPSSKDEIIVSREKVNAFKEWLDK